MAAEEGKFDPYLKWLGIRPKDQPPHHYRLLGIDLFESDPDVISNAADARMLLVKTFQTGSNASLSQKILNEVAAAKVCLLSPQKKAEYDRRLREKLQAAPAQSFRRRARKSKPWVATAVAVALLVTVVGLWTLSRAPVQVGKKPPDEAHKLPDASPGVAPVDLDAPVRQPTTPPLRSSAEREGHAPSERVAAVEPAGDSRLDRRAGSLPASDGAVPRAADGARWEPTPPPDAEGAGENPAVAEEAPAVESRDSSGDSLPSDDTSGADAGRGASAPTAPPTGRPAAQADSLVAAASPRRLPVPDPQQQQRVERELRSNLRSEFARAKRPQQKLALADKLFKQALESDDDPLTQYVLLRMACDLGSSVGELGRTLQAVDEIASRYDVSPLELKADVLATTLEATRGAPALSVANLDVIENGLLLADQALIAGEPELADRFSKLAGTVARRTKSRELLQEVLARARAVERLKEEAESFQRALRTLEEAPEDAGANLVVGRWYCFVKDRWEEGLSYLAKGSDAALAALAEKELQEPTDPHDQLVIGQRWWRQAEGEGGYVKARILLRAEHWFKRVLPTLSGEVKASTEDRLEKIAQFASVLKPGQLGEVEPGNVALYANRTRVAGGADGADMLDGIIPTVRRSGGIASSPWPCQWRITFEKVYRLREIRLKLPEGRNSYYQYVVSTSPDGKNFFVLADRSKARAFGWQRILFPSRPVKTIELRGLFHSGDSRFYVSELEAYCVPPTTPAK